MPFELREAFERALALAERAHRGGEGGHAVAALHASEVDRIVVGLFEEVLQELGSEGAGVALVALGGYGRRELAPYSDLDLLLVHRGWRPSDVERLNRAVMYPLWDAGRDLGNRVREVREITRVPHRTEEAAALLDARFLAGDHRLFLDAEGALLGWFQRSRARVLRRLRANNLSRHGAHGHAGHLLEPDLRDSAGGLRDIHSLGWAAGMVPGGLVEAGHMSELDRERIRAASGFLLRVRIELHLGAGRRQDLLYLADQDAVAERLGYADAPGLAPGDALMRDLYNHARGAADIVESVWERLAHRRRRFARSAVRTLGDGCVVRDGRLEVVAVPSPQQDPAGWLSVFVHALQDRLPIDRSSLNRLEAACADGGEVPWTPGARSAFMHILQGGRPGARVLEALDSTGLLSALLPEWAPIRCCPQRNLYHRYSVDIHAFAAVAELVASRSSSEPDVADAWSRVGDAETLVLGTLLHDVGKGRGGDHVVVGEELARDAVTRMGLGPAAVAEVELLVREHLALAETATRRDLNDERTATDIASRTGDARTLAMLFLLTRADAIATGPEAWSGFRASLIRELYAKALNLTERGATPDKGLRGRLEIRELLGREGLAPEETDRLVAAMPAGWLPVFDASSAVRQLLMMRRPPGGRDAKTSVRRGEQADELIVVAGDRPGLFAAVSGVLAYRGVNVLSADVFTRADGAALEVFRVTGAHGPVPADRWDSIRRDISEAVAGRLDVEEALRTKTPRRGMARRRHAPTVVVDNGVSDFYTVIEVHATDRPGLLHTITRALALAGCDLHRAKVATYGVDVVDVFYVRDLEGQRIEAAEDIRRIESAVLGALSA